ncbi:MAG: hypothetical protein UR27_C0008G0012 [Candidatus Peregrinibacteria bacterium GW2011_GWA2_33_10]|nr:MAG: hypothetical protein UR27_C0008G0012 [Candidatus Peregrinibacteria bacterium GW2011_GWA2_33_10]
MKCWILPWFVERLTLKSDQLLLNYHIQFLKLFLPNQSDVHNFEKLPHLNLILEFYYNLRQVHARTPLPKKPSSIQMKLLLENHFPINKPILTKSLPRPRTYQELLAYNFSKYCYIHYLNKINFYNQVHPLNIFHLNLLHIGTYNNCPRKDRP